MLNGHLLSVLGTFGFRFHHSEPEYAVLNQWLKGTENKIPPFATHLVGVAGFVLNHKKEVLLVKEGSKVSVGRFAYRSVSPVKSVNESGD